MHDDRSSTYKFILTITEQRYSNPPSFWLLLIILVSSITIIMLTIRYYKHGTGIPRVVACFAELFRCTFPREILYSTVLFSFIMHILTFQYDFAFRFYGVLHCPRCVWCSACSGFVSCPSIQCSPVHYTYKFRMLSCFFYRFIKRYTRRNSITRFTSYKLDATFCYYVGSSGRYCRLTRIIYYPSTSSKSDTSAFQLLKTKSPRPQNNQKINSDTYTYRYVICWYRGSNPSSLSLVNRYLNVFLWRQIDEQNAY